MATKRISDETIAEEPTNKVPKTGVDDFQAALSLLDDPAPPTTVESRPPAPPRVSVEEEQKTTEPIKPVEPQPSTSKAVAEYEKEAADAEESAAEEPADDEAAHRLKLQYVSFV